MMLLSSTHLYFFSNIVKHVFISLLTIFTSAFVNYLCPYAIGKFVYCTFNIFLLKVFSDTENIIHLYLSCYDYSPFYHLFENCIYNIQIIIFFAVITSLLSNEKNNTP